MAVSYNNGITGTEKSITDEDISQIEKKYKFVFPNDIREHYLMYNGGELKRYTFVDSEGYKYVVQQLIPIKYDDLSGTNVESVLEMLRIDNVLPDWLIPFADEPGGDLFCFSLKKDEEGAVYYWSHEYEYGEDPEEQVNYLAKSFKEFFDAMK